MNYTISVMRRSGGDYRESCFTGTLDYLIDEVFSYTLLCGNSHDSRINTHPKTIKSLVNALNKSAYVCGNYFTFYTLKK